MFVSFLRSQQLQFKGESPPHSFPFSDSLDRSYPRVDLLLSEEVRLESRVEAPRLGPHVAFLSADESS